MGNLFRRDDYFRGLREVQVTELSSCTGLVPMCCERLVCSVGRKPCQCAA